MKKLLIIFLFLSNFVWSDSSNRTTLPESDLSDDPSNHLEDVIPDVEALYPKSDHHPIPKPQIVTLESMPNAIVAGCVNAITGDYFESTTDLVVQGSHPLTVQRTYCSSGGWEFSYMPTLEVGYSSKTQKHLHASFQDNNGGAAYYGDADFPYFKLSSKMYQYGMTNCSSGDISGQTNWKNSYLRYRRVHDEKFYFLKLGTGAIRTFERNKYTGRKHGAPIGKFHIINERLPNGNQLTFEYNHQDKLNKVSLLNSQRNEIAAITLAHGRRIIWSSLDEKVQYGFSDSDRENLSYVYSSHGETHYSYDDERIIKKTMNNNTVLSIEYCDSDSHRHLAKKGAVKTLKAPVGPNNCLVDTYHFHYFTTATKVRDALGNLTTYVFDINKRLRVIRHPRKILDQFYWGTKETEGNLLSRVFEDAEKKYFCRKLDYDKKGNIIEEQLWGNLTGNSKPLEIDSGIPKENGCEVYKKTFQASQDGFNLPLHENDGRKIIECTYYPTTNLLKSRYTRTEHTIYKREFFKYDSSGAVVEEVWDDSPSLLPPKDINDLQGATERHIRYTTRTKIGLPETIEEYYFDQNCHSLNLLKKTHNTYYPQGWIKEQKHYGSDKQLAYVLKWEYDICKNVISETNASGETTTYEYDINSNKTLQKGPREGFSKKFTYDLANRLIKEEEVWPNGQHLVAEYTYNELNQRIKTIDVYGKETCFHYDELGRLEKIDYPDASHKQFQYDAMNHLIDEWDENGNNIHKEYTIRGEPYLIKYPDGSVEKKEYTLDGLLCKETAKNGLTTYYTHDFLGRVIKTEKKASGVSLCTTHAVYNTFHLLSETDENGNITKYEYDGAGRKIRVTKGDHVTTYTYDALGRIAAETKGSIRIVRQYDFKDKIIQEQIENLEGIVQKREEFKYDVDGNRIEHILFTQAGKATTQKTYTPHGEPISITDALGNTSHIDYTIRRDHPRISLIITKTDPLGNSEVTKYDARGRICEKLHLDPHNLRVQEETRSYDPAGHHIQTISKVYPSNEKVITQWNYDSMGQMIHCVEAADTLLEKHTHVIYNSFGQKEKVTKPDKNIIKYQYDELGRLKEIESYDVHYTYCYDANDNPLIIQDVINGSTIHRTYDEHDRIKSEIINQDEYSYSYDDLDRPIEVRFPDQSIVRYIYDGNDLIEVQRVKNDQTIYSHRYSRYDQAGNIITEQLPFDIGNTTHSYDFLERVVSSTSPHWEQHIPPQGFDAAGNLLQRHVSDHEGAFDYIYTYDALYQLTSENQETYQYDSLNNRIAKNDVPCTINSLNQLTQHSNNIYVYDANGNLTQIQGQTTFTFSYDVLDRLIEVNNGNTIVKYQYDAFHRRLSKTIDRTTTYFLYQGDNEVGSINPTRKEFRMLGLGSGAEIGATLAIEIDDEIYIPIHDPYGNIVTLLDRTGSVVENYRPTAFGEESHTNSINPWRYCSKRKDPETGFVYFGKRYYSPEVGRWITPDPAGFADGLNLYTYVHNHPLAYIDPDGQLAFLLIPIAFSLIEPCLPAVAACLSQYTYGVAVAGAITSFVEGYNDPSKTFTNIENFADSPCNAMAGLLGTLVNLRGAGVKTATNMTASVFTSKVGSLALTEGKVLTNKVVQRCTQNATRATTQKVTQNAERCIIDLSKKNADLPKRLRFAQTAADHMKNPNRFVPRHILSDAIQTGIRQPDPKNLPGAIKIVQTMYRNNKKYSLNIIYKEGEDVITHFHYE